MAKFVTIDISDEFSLADVMKNQKQYSPLGDKIISDLRRCFLVVMNTSPQIFLFKDFDSITKSYKVSYVNEAVAKQKLTSISLNNCVIDGKVMKMNCWKVYQRNTAKFVVSGTAFYSTDPHVFSYFRGYDIKQVPYVKEAVIKPWLNHVHDVIANGNEEVYKYILLWVASVLQKPAFKTEVAIVILGKQGAGKNKFFTDVICRLMARYANKNVTNIESVVGTFNDILENKKLLILNELQSIDMNKYLNSDALKSVISEDVININAKYQPVRSCENVANLILVSNNNTPIKIDSDDRRYMVTKASDKHCKDWEYFEKLNNTFTPEFYENLFTFFMTMDLAKANLRKIPETEAKENIKEATMSTYELFVSEYYSELVDITGPELYNLYSRFCKDNGFSIGSSRTMHANLTEFMPGSKPKRTDIGVKRVYSLYPEIYEKFKKQEEELINLITDDA